MNHSIFLSNVGPPVSSDRITDLLNSINCPPPLDYLNFLANTNGGVPSNIHFPISNYWADSTGEIVSFLSIDSEEPACDLIRAHQSLCDRLPTGYFPIANTTADYVVLSTLGVHSGNIWFLALQEWDFADRYKGLFPIASSFDELLAVLY